MLRIRGDWPEPKSGMRKKKSGLSPMFCFASEVNGLSPKVVEPKSGLSPKFCCTSEAGSEPSKT